MGKFIDLTGQKFGKLTAINRIKTIKKQTMWLCTCDCGNAITVQAGNLKNGHTKSCGCYQNEKLKDRLGSKNPNYKHGVFMTKKEKKRIVYKHGKTKTRLYEIWRGMKKRCYLQSHVHYESYGGRGIAVCDEWLNNFINFYYWAIENGYNDTLTIDRIDVNGNYEPHNCRWATWQMQQNNKRINRIIEFNNQKRTMSEWAKIYNINVNTLESRLRAGKSIKEALTIPVKAKV